MKKKLFIPLVLLLIVIPTLIPLLNSRFFYTQDHIFIARLNQMFTALSDGQFPVRWSPDLRYGEPTFNFYAPLPYYIGAIIHLLGFNFIWTAKILFMLSVILSAMAMYLLANSLFGRKAGFFAAVLYTYAPYRAVDMYVRGSLSETWAFIFFPLIFYSSLVLIKNTNLKNIILLSLSLAGLFLTHNVSTLMFLPFLIFWWLYLLFTEKKWKAILHLILASILGFGLAAFFLLPAFFETNFIQTKYLTVGYFNFRIHFVAFKQLFSLFWGYGSSVWGPDDGLSFQIGLAHWLIMALLLGVVLILRTKRKAVEWSLFLGISFLFSLFLQHSKSDFIWEAISAMEYIQFPWRFLAISIFLISISGAAVINYLKVARVFIYIGIIFIVMVNLLYFRPKDYVDDSFFDKFLNTEKMHQGIDLTKDYLPIWVTTTEGDRFDLPRSEEGKVIITNLQKGSIKYNFTVEAFSGSLLEVPITYFPGWQVKVNNQPVQQTLPSTTGLIRFELPPGQSQVKIEFVDTSIRKIGNIISAVLVLLVVLLLVYGERRKFQWIRQ